MKRTKKEPEAVSDPNVLKLTEVEALRWGKMDAEMRNTLQGARLEELELELLARNYVQQKQAKEALRQRLLLEIEQRKKEYTEFTATLAEKYKINPEKMAIDPDTGVIREL